jgi:hypothetical protein
MLRKLGLASSTEMLLLPPGQKSPSRNSSPEPGSPGSPFLSGAESGNVIERSALEKSIRTLESMLGALNEYSELTARMARCQKRIARCSREMATSLKEEGVKEPSVIGRCCYLFLLGDFFLVERTRHAQQPARSSHRALSSKHCLKSTASM